MYQEKEFLSALVELPNTDKLEQLESKYTALILFQIAERCIKAGLVDKNVVSFQIDTNRQKFSVSINNKNNPVTDKGTELLEDVL